MGRKWRGGGGNLIINITEVDIDFSVTENNIS